GAEFHAYLLLPIFLVLTRERRGSWIMLVAGVAFPTVFYLTSGVGPDPPHGAVTLIRCLPLFGAGCAASLLSGELRRFARPAAIVGVFGSLALLQFRISALSAGLLIVPTLIGVLYAPWAKRLFEGRWMLELGRISYSLFMVHTLVQVFVLDR